MVCAALRDKQQELDCHKSTEFEAITREIATWQTNHHSHHRAVLT